MKFADTSVVILCYNRLDEVMLNVPPRLADVVNHGLELVVVDNASADGSKEYLIELASQHAHFTLVLNDENLGVGAGRNSGWERTTREFVVTLDEDTRITSEQLESLVDELRLGEDVGIVTPVMFNAPDGRLLVEILDGKRQVTNFHGACYVVRREVIDKVGMHDPRCDFGGEELDLSIRTRAAGWDVVQHPTLRVAHNARPRSAEVGLQRRMQWTQNHARVMWVWFPYPQAVLWSGIHLVAVIRPSLRRRSIRDPLRLCRAWVVGASEGARIHQPVGQHLVAFYRKRLGFGAKVAKRKTGPR